MPRVEAFMEMQQLHHDGLNVCVISRQLNIDRKTVRKYLRPRPSDYLRAQYRNIGPICRSVCGQRVRNACRLFREIQLRG
jgi:transposase